MAVIVFARFMLATAQVIPLDKQVAPFAQQLAETMGAAVRRCCGHICVGEDFY